jgi:hypothetical protein
VTTQRNYRNRPARKGEPYSSVADGTRLVFDQETVSQALVRALVSHLTEECAATEADREALFRALERPRSMPAYSRVTQG